MAPLSIGIGMRMTGGIGAGIPGLLFYAPLRSDLVPVFAAGSATPTFTRATSAWRLNPSTNFYEEITAGNARFETPGYLTEGSRINRAGRSGQSGDALWTASANMTVTSNDVAGPFGTTTADLLLADGSGNETLIQDLGVIGSDEGTYSTFLKRKTGSGVVQITRDGGSTWTNVTIDATNFTRVSKTQTLANPDVGIRIVNSNESVWVEQHQDEIGAFKSSPIVTPGDGAVTRNADVLSYVLSGNANAGTDDGTIICKFDDKGHNGTWSAVAPANLISMDNTGNNRFELQGDLPKKLTFVYGTGSATKGASHTYGTYPTGSIQVAVTYGSGGGELFTEGVPRASDATASDFGSPTDIDVGHRSNTEQPFGNIQDIRIYDRVLTDAEILSLA